MLSTTPEAGLSLAVYNRHGKSRPTGAMKQGQATPGFMAASDPAEGWWLGDLHRRNGTRVLQ